MVGLEAVRKHNATLKSYGPNLVAVFVGGTSGIGESTARKFVKETVSPRVYLAGRNENQASRIIEELHQLNPDSKVQFVKCDAARLKSVDEACKTIQEKEDKVNLLFMTAGILTMKGPDETDEGLDKKLSLHYYSRMRFLNNLLPQLTNAGTSEGESSPKGLAGSLSRVVSVLEAGGEVQINTEDLSLKQNYSLRNCAKHAITMTSLSMAELAKAHPTTSFVHAYPGAVKTGLSRDMGLLGRTSFEVAYLLMKPWTISLDESGERHLYAATSPRFPPLASRDVEDAETGADATKGSGSYLLNSDGSRTGSEKVWQEFRKNETGKLVWKHTLGVFESICGAISK